MIIYKNSVGGYYKDSEQNALTVNLIKEFKDKTGRRPSEQEVRSWQNSLAKMYIVLHGAQIESDSGVLIEYQIPKTGYRIDFTLTGHDESGNENAVLIELKQWDEVKQCDSPREVLTFVAHREREVLHPSVQVFQYRKFIEDFNTAFHENILKLNSCAYLHNYYPQKKNDPLYEAKFSDYLEKSPLFNATQEETVKLQEYLRKYVGKGKGMETLLKIEEGKIKPSKKLINHINGLFKGRDEFILLDDQLVIFDAVVNEAKKLDKSKNKKVFIIEGGPGTGKSVVALRLLGEILKMELNCYFVAPNATFRNAICEKLTQENKKSTINFLFKGSGNYIDAKKNDIDVLVVDEAHRTKEKSGMFENKGENQVKEIINAAKLSVFFIDENQRIRPQDIGSIEQIKKWAKHYDAEVYDYELSAQFRCSGAEGFINWLDDVLQIQNTANFDGFEGDYEFKICDTPQEVYETIVKKSKKDYSARVAATFAWKWSTKLAKDRKLVNDVVIPDQKFEMPWNARSHSTYKNGKLNRTIPDSQRWPINPNGVQQIGCIHTAQGLEFDYVGVIIGPDMYFDIENEKVMGNIKNCKDSKIRSGNTKDFTVLVKNTVKTLMTRGMRGCFVYCVDKNLQEYLKSRFKV
jgi:DUF2075 family protein